MSKEHRQAWNDAVHQVRRESAAAPRSGASPATSPSLSQEEDDSMCVPFPVVLAVDADLRRLRRERDALLAACKLAEQFIDAQVPLRVSHRETTLMHLAAAIALCTPPPDAGEPR